ncbi:MAG: cation-transporting P-type ATPase [Spirochaetaceae bacterium]|nr:MAG: cation-transporting P-type ATPase [Spirochaetaceae bacterium]
MDTEQLKAYALAVDDVLASLETDGDGLSTTEAQSRLERHGANRLPTGRKKNPVLKFLHHFHDMLIYVLLAAAVGTALLGHWIDTWIILAVVVINGVVGYLQEGKAEKAIDAVRSMLSVSNRVLRDGEKITVDAEELVPGDIVLLSSGDRVPADLRILQLHELRVNEASLTGESETVAKSSDPVDEDAALGDRSCMAYSGTIVSSGTATAVVVSTGEQTEIGRINRMLSDVETLTTPLLRQVNRFGIALSIIIVGLATLVFALGFFLARMPLDELFLAVVGIAVAAIPEGLPAVMSIILAIGVRRMAGRHAIIRRLPGVETLGSVAVICTDKTGTLTRSEMTVTRVVLSDRTYKVEGAGYAPDGRITGSDGDQPIDLETAPGLTELLTAGVLCNEARIYRDAEDTADENNNSDRDDQWRVDGNPTEGALLTLAAKAGLDPAGISRQWSRIDSIPFESDHKFMATLNDGEPGRRIFLKGAPEAVLQRCAKRRTSDGETEDIDADWWRRRAEELAGEGFRLLAVAAAECNSSDGDNLSFERVERGFTLLGFTAITDPPRPEAIEAVAECRRAGIQVKMITGDHALTARAIAQQMRLGENDRVMTGPEIERASDDELFKLVDDVDVYARVSPEHKLRLVTALQKRGHITAMTGDGVNDAPALKKADIGIAMGIKGTEAAKEAAEMVLADDNFASIAHAVEEGRTVYDNLKKSLLFMLPTNGGEALIIIIAIALGLVIPITPAQVLWVNMVTAVTLALALAFEPMERDVMQRPPRRSDEPLVPPALLARIGYVSLLLMAGSLGLFTWYRSADVSREYARTVAVNTLIVGEIFYLFNSRYMRDRSLSLRGLRATPQVWGAVVVVLLLQIPFTYLPAMQTLFGTAALQPVDWLRMAGVGLALFLIVETEKALTRRWAAAQRSRVSPE